MSIVISQSGTTLYFAVIVLAFLLGAVVAVSSLMLREVRFSGQAGTSVLALFAADGGGEKALYEARKNNNFGNFTAILDNGAAFDVTSMKSGVSVTIQSFGEAEDSKRAIQITFQE